MKLTHKTARGVLIATDTIATNSYWMVDTTHPAYAATVDRLGGVNRKCLHFTSWGQCKADATPWETPDLSIGKVFTDTVDNHGRVDPRPWVKPDMFSDNGFIVDNDFTPILAGYELRCFYPLPSMRHTYGQVGLYEDDGRLVGVVMAHKLP